MPNTPRFSCRAEPADEVSRRLSAADLNLSAFIDGVSTRRGSLMAALQHGVASVGTRGYLTDQMLLNEDGSMARLPDLRGFCEKHGLQMCTIADLIEYRRRREKLIRREIGLKLPTDFGVFDLPLGGMRQA